MKLELLKMMIEAACADGIVTGDELDQLKIKAAELNISDSELQFLIKGELDKLRSQSSFGKSDNENVSGFITQNNQTKDNSDKSLVSGFYSTENEHITHDMKFSDITTLNRQGAMSLVQKAKYHGKWVIIKRIKPEHANDEGYKSLLIKEFENAYHLDHPNIVRLLDRDEDELGLYYTMEFIDGTPLSDLITPNGIKDRSLIRRIASQILDALGYVHKKQIFHRDLKPDNILITYRGNNVKILDFGLAAADSFEDHLKKAGTPKYTAPEQAIDSSVIDQRADIYSFGVILLEMVCGKTKLENCQDAQTYTKIISRCLQQNPDDRYSNCDQIIKEIKTVEKQVHVIPPELEKKIKQYCLSGELSRSERKVLEIEAEAINIAPNVLDAFIKVELEHKREEIAKKKEKEKARKKEQERKRTLEEKRKKESKTYGRETKKTPKIGRFILIMLIIAFVVFIIFKSQSIIDEYKERTNTDVKRMYVKAKGLNMREAMDVKSAKIKSFPFGTEVIVYEIEGGWARVRIGDEKGYMYTKYLSDDDKYIDILFKDIE